MTACDRKTDFTGQDCGAIRGGPLRFIKNEYILLFAGYIITCFACYLYVIFTGNGLRALYGDSWVYTDLAKRIAFNHSLLHNDYVNSIIYPPLYPLLISIAYFFRDQAAIFTTIKIVNILVYASAFYPLFYLLKYYSGLTRSQSFAGAILLLLNWCALGYVTYITSEPLYCPLLVWFAWFLADNKHLKSKFDLLLFIMIFSALPLTKSIGNLVFPFFAGTMIIKLIYIRNNHLPEDSGKLIWRSATVLVAAGLIMLLYNMYLKAVLPQSHGDIFGGYFSISADPLMRQTLLKPAYWFNRTAFSFSWILIGTGTAAVPLLFSIVLKKSKILYTDVLACFSFMLLAGTFILVPLFTSADPLGDAHQRYFDPLLFLFILILLKYSRFADKSVMVTAGVITLIGLILAPPLTAHASCFALSRTHPWVVYVLLYGGGSAVFACMLFILYKQRNYFVYIFFGMMAVSIPALHFLDYLGGNKLGPNIFSFYDGHGITRAALAERSSNPSTELIVDRSWRYFRGSLEYCDYREYMTVLINLPMVPAYKDLNQYLFDPKNKGKRFMVLTHKTIPNAAKTVKGQDIALYIFEL